MTSSVDFDDVARIRATIAKCLQVTLEQVTLDTGLDSLKVDLVALAQLALAFEDAFHIEIPDDDWLDLITVGQMVACVLECRAQASRGGKRDRPRA